MALDSSRARLQRQALREPPRRATSTGQRSSPRSPWSVLRDAFSSHPRIEVDTQGDALFYAFSKDHDAVTAAVEAHPLHP